jgi:hypothetical protein
MRKFFIAATISLLAVAYGRVVDDFTSPEWKDEIARGYLPYRKLTYDDFPVSDGVPARHLMHTEGFFHYTFKSKWLNRGGAFVAHVVEMNVRSGFDQNKSWRRSTFSETRALLEHEQGHLDINELHTAQLRSAKWPEGTGASSTDALNDLKEKISALCKKIGDESNKEQERYDEETAHGVDAKQQARWTEALRKRVEENKITYWDKNA